MAFLKLRIPQDVSPKGIFTILLLLSLFIETHSTLMSCPKHCQCSPKEKKANCSISHKKIPKLPTDISWFVLFKSNFSKLEKESMKNLKNSLITRMTLQACSIKHMSSDVFQGLNHLVRLEISQSPDESTRIVSEINFSLTKIEELYLTDNHHWRTLSEKMFQMANGGNITYLSVFRTSIELIAKNVFTGLNELKELSLTSNKNLHDISLQGMPFSVTKLDLSKNSFTVLPMLCVNESESYLPFLEILNLGNNRISKMEASSFTCMKNLKQLSLKSNEIRTFKNKVFQAIPSLYALNLNSQTEKVKHIESSAFSSQSLSVLKFRDNRFIFHKPTELQLFSACPNLTYLDISKNYLKFNSSSIRTLFLPLQNLSTLILANVEMSSLPVDLFPHLRSLRELILTGNEITGWKNDLKIFGNMNWLRKLRLDKNDIKLINKTSFSRAMLSSLEVLDLSNNIFSCSCKLRWFRNWINDNGSLILEHWPHKYICEFPPRLNGKPLINFNISEDKCMKPNPVIIAAIILSVLIFVIVIVASVIDTMSGKYKYKQIEN